MEYNHKTIEKKWQDKWFQDLHYKAEDFAPNKPKYYLLAEFPYPSGDSMHMGHARNYSMMDSIARLRRMKGENVLYPIGYDAFGLPTENYAIKVKRPPQEITNENIVIFRKQLKSLGFSFDWDREVNTTDPEYYKWTQWIFLKFYEKGLAYKTEMPINWCPKCKVGCANEEVIDGKHERCDTEVEERNISQWVLKITEYADRLQEDLELTDYLESIKSRQRNWIGKKTWYDIVYKIKDTDQEITVSTTRPDTQFGASFVVIAPESEILNKLQPHIDNKIWEEIETYQKASKKKTEIDRLNEKREKTGVNTGLFCVNSITQQEMPIYIADFVLTTVGTGCVVGVPAHDKRDFEFAQKFNLPVKRVIEGPDSDRREIKNGEDVYEDEGIVFESGFMTDLSTQDARVEAGKYIKENNIGDVVTRFHLRDWVFSRQHYWGEPIPIVHCEKCGEIPVPEDQLPVELPVVESYEPTETGESPLVNITQWVNTECPKCGGPAKRETDTMPNWAGSSWYYLRYIDPDNSDKFADFEKLKYWLPVDHYEGGPEHVTLHLLYSRFWHKLLYDEDLVPTIEPYKRRTTHGVVLGEDGQKMSKSKGNVITPDHLIEKYGADVTRGYLLFMGPYEGDVSWSTETINGVQKFVSRYYKFLLSSWENRDDNLTESNINILRLIKKVEKDVLNFKFNTAISAFMKFFNENNGKIFSKTDLENLFICTAVIFPHLAEEIWEKTGHDYTIHTQEWPEIDDALLEEDQTEIPVQINGKVRGKVLVNSDDTEEVVRQKVSEEQAFSAYLSDGEIKKFIYIPNRIVNIVK